MSEKLRQCREDLAAALDRALEGNIVSPVFPSDSEWLESARLLEPDHGAFIDNSFARLCPSFSSPHFTQTFLQMLPERGPYYCMPKELALMDCNNVAFKVKWLVYGNGENFIMNANVPVPYGPLKSGCENTDNITQEYISPSQETNNHTCPETQGNNSCEELTKNLLEVIESTSIRTLEALAGKLEPLSEFCPPSSQSAGSVSAEDTLTLFFADPPCSPIRKEPHLGKYKLSDDDNLINIVLDMEEDYNILKKI
ncbi:uncharacterized protein C3orf62 homolog [Hypanus sabinus]|uniref:uncharacterized protein C3orf62 homolog n=1 Tax=Hypanus sabinus TaxID=79690 RepID=UPI0028C4C75A|nr:uncharacterized protein C3orf62 homolog [Hypanus sabinus]